MTTLPASVFGMKDRGQLRPGAFADVVIFDLAKINDSATYEDPHQLAEGMNDIIVNGEVARRNGTFTTALAGRVLRPERH
jgi:N-acyl-D-aspartate/D-glutamate deacylase